MEFPDPVKEPEQEKPQAPRAKVCCFVIIIISGKKWQRETNVNVSPFVLMKPWNTTEIR